MFACTLSFCIFVNKQIFLGKQHIINLKKADGQPRGASLAVWGVCGHCPFSLFQSVPKYFSDFPYIKVL
jgi:hypothetical protein